MYESCEFGLAVCVFEPRGEKGLEGYQLGEQYAYRKMKSVTPGQPPYYRVFPTFDSDYYETCSTRTFNRFFKKEKSA
ncbi:TPA: hypothetical protein ACPJ1H_003965 [Vibrio alginolyticus]|uniref:hypothetical protein n=1 Tax=Vibrio alginolyticus TaxID=663 RepID=UPI002119DF7B|nr:hypothetical protein [Vibrio alginolyticus]MCQ9070882.1 hypothetical protein [Vibrio alginolyticus]MCR9484040.1 hypothetical protein [Vibrio alginolyticus]